MQVVVEPHRAAGTVGEIGEDVAGSDLHLAVGDLLRVGQKDLVELLLESEKNRAGESVEIAAGDESHLWVQPSLAPA